MTQDITMENLPNEATVGGERVRVLGPKPDGWEGLGQTYADAVLVAYPSTPACPGEIGAVPLSDLRSADDAT
jgi:hypothetical protein